ncbi:hypothetical protein SAMN05519104_6262 [Rhizobiales bacterium GAS188]|nr:hypothetical protein SAMN05519104_6262 [Rhizobiales bacterium GAS188]
MSISKFGHACLIAVVATLFTSAPSRAAPSTSKGQISVVQVMEMLTQAPSNPTARQVLTAYLAGLGETAGILIDAAVAGDGTPVASCNGHLSLDDKAARHALEAAAPSRDHWAETPATPLIVRDMIDRAGCKITG